jgi:hypothetical protein
MYPTLVAGLVLVLVAVHYARHPEANRLRLVRSLQLLVAFVGTLGFVTGVIRAFTSIPEVSASDAGAWAIVGVGEAMNCIGLALAMLVASTIATSVGVARASSQNAELADPHQPQ